MVPSKRPAEEQEAAWIADEDRFALQQAKKKAALRVKGGRAQPIDILAVALVAMEPERCVSGFEEETEGLEDLPIDPEAAFDGLTEDGLAELEKGIEGYEVLESSRSNVDYWSVCPACSEYHSCANADRPSDHENHCARTAKAAERPAQRSRSELRFSRC